ncbi:3-oxoacyl-[acyl-carrier-protein] synthase III C-terminal domain-containing protein [Streptomyces sp. NPDC020996]|uniref:3-oxoacyl-[acyl-carrier-protein] synthase III C-terminal domain-containing protein n=1 Tax=Streptomyces sp. NPDC020996 TaxID=3154791 RepID=UPI00340DF462
MASADRTAVTAPAAPAPPAARPAGGGPPRLRLQRVAPFVPGTTVAIGDLRDRLGLTRAEVRLFTGFLGLDRVPMAEGMTGLDMLLRAGEAVLDGADRDRVRHLVHPHTLLHIAPPAHRWMITLREKLRLPAASAFELSHQNCTSGLFGLRLLEALLRTDPPGAQGLLLIADKITSPLAQKIAGTTILGEAAAAVLAGLDGPGDEVIGQAHRTLGEYHASLDMPADLRRHYSQLYLPTMLEVLQEAVADAGLTLGEVDRILPHNVNRHSWVKAAQQLGLPTERFYLENVPRTGHCFGADPFVNLVSARAESAVRPGDAVALLSAGSSGTFSAVLLRLDDLPARAGVGTPTPCTEGD